MQHPYLIALAASVLAALVTTLGISFTRFFEPWARANSIYFVSFAAGVLIAVALLHLIPESQELAGRRASLFVLAGYLALYVFNRFVCALVCERGPEVAHGLGIVPLVGIGFHSFIDGVVYSVAFRVSLFTGGLTALGMVGHEFPEGIMTYLLLVRAGHTPRRALGLALSAAAITTPLGTLLSFPLIDKIDPPTLGMLLALSAGALLYVGATHLLPQAEHERRRFSMLALAAGVGVAVLVVVAEGR